MSLIGRVTSTALAVIILAVGCGYNPKRSGGRSSSDTFKGTVECLYPDMGCHAVSGSWTDPWADGVHANGDNDPSFALSGDECTDCHNPIEDGRNENAFLFTTNGAIAVLTPVVRPITGCEACHGSGSDHYAYAHADTADQTPPTLHPEYDPALGDTHYLPDINTVNESFSNIWHTISCGPCHARTYHKGGSSFDDILTNQYAEWWKNDGTGFFYDDGHSDSLVVETQQGFMTSTIRGVPCAACHTVEGFVTWFAQGDTSWGSSQSIIDRLISETGDTEISDPSSVPGTAALPQVSCVTCHPAHEPGRVIRDPFTPTSLCVTCHNVRGLAAGTGSGQAGTGDLETPRHPQKELFEGYKTAANDGYRGVETLPGFSGSDSEHAGSDNIPGGCAGCHYIAVTDVDYEEYPLQATTGHRFLPRLENCLTAGCHEMTDFLLSDGTAASYENSTIASFDFGSIFYSGPIHGGIDHDKDGDVEPFQEEISDMLDELKDRLTGRGIDFDSSQGLFDLTEMASRTTTERAAAYNYDFVAGDGSRGMHNPLYVVNLLAVSISAVP
jgi:hypothetical protein